MANILPRDLDPAVSVPDDAALIVDNGVNVQKATPAQIVETGRPLANQAEAEAGANAEKAMTPLTTKQAIEAQGAVLFATAAQGSLADSAVQPGDLGALATKDQVDIADIDASGTPMVGTYLQGDGSWSTPTGAGDLLAANNLSDLDDIPTAIANLSAMLSAIAGLTGDDGSFIRWTGSASAAMQDIVGTVSESGGVPTGAIVERGSNANGAYVRFADGTQICVKEITGLGPISTTFGSGVFIDGGNAMGTYAAAFISTPFPSVSSGNPGNTSSWVAYTNAGNTTTGPSFFLARGNSSANTNFTARMISVGRWF